jgi:hypothetical protein
VSGFCPKGGDESLGDGLVWENSCGGGFGKSEVVVVTKGSLSIAQGS